MSSSSPSFSSAVSSRPWIRRIYGDVRFRIDGELMAIGFAADGSAWSVEESGVLRHWEGETGELRSRVELSDLEVGWTFSPDCRWLASIGDALSIWDTETGNLRTTLAQSSWVTAVAFRPDGKMLATGHDDAKVRLWDLKTGRHLAELAGHSDPISALAFSRDGRQLASASEDKTICLWDSDKHEKIGRLEGHTDRIQALAWHPLGDRLVSAGWDTTARVWDTTTLEPIILLNGHGNVVSALAFSPDGKILASADSNQVVWLWDFQASKPMQMLHGHGGDITSLAFRADGKRLLSGGHDRRLLLWEIPSCKNLVGVSGRTCESARISVSPDGKRLACVNGSAPVRVWDTETGASAFEFSPVEKTLVAAYSPDGKWLAVGDARKLVHLCDPQTGKVAQWLEGHHAAISALAFSPDGKVLASAGGTDGYVFFWSMETFQPTLLIPHSTDNGTAETIAWCPNSNRFVAGGVDFMSTGGSDGVVCIWDVVERKEVGMLSGGTTRIAVRPDCRQLAAVTLTESFCIWDLTTQTLIKEVQGHEGNVTCLAYDPQGKHLATAGDDKMIRLWHPETADLLAEIELDTTITDLQYSPDGKSLYTANADTTCYQIDVEVALA